MPEDIFVDTSAFYALLMRGDGAHGKMVLFLDAVRQGKQRWITTDYILDESATLLLARGYPHLAEAVLDLPEKSRALEVQWMDADRFARTRIIFSKYMDQGVSFTDCFSFCVMQDSGLRRVLTKDRHFDCAGFKRMLPV
jgi:uncharacterized protein